MQSQPTSEMAPEFTMRCQQRRQLGNTKTNTNTNAYTRKYTSITVHVRDGCRFFHALVTEAATVKAAPEAHALF